jgi:hypothetical protein
MRMQGSLDAPPIVIRSSRGNSALMLAISAVFVAIGAFMLRDPEQSAAISWLIIIVFAAGIPFFGWRLIRPDILTLSPDGVIWRGALRTVHWKWGDAQNFRPYSPAGKTISKHVGFDFTDNARASRLRHATKAMTGVEGSLGGGWELSAAELAELLNTARARWVAKDG